MKYLPKDTLAYFNAAPQTHLHDLSAVPTAVLAASSQAYKTACTMTSPQEDAMLFYTLNHCASIVRKSFTPHEPLPEWARSIMQSYTDACMAQGERMLHYILLITTREMRHWNGHGSLTQADWKTIEDDGTATMVTFIKSLKEGAEDQASKKYLTNPPAVTIAEYMKGLSAGFHRNGKGWGGGYGGVPWGRVADAAVGYVTGSMSLEMMVNTGYELAHNGGPIFDKTDVKIYNYQDANALLTTLDVQRSGQMLDLMLASQTFGIHKLPQAEQAALLIKEHAPKECKGYVDWKLVDELRPDKDKASNPNKYHKHMGAQAQPKTKPPAPKPVKPEPPKVVTLHGKKVTVTGTYQVYPSAGGNPPQTVTVVKREGA